VIAGHDESPSADLCLKILADARAFAEAGWPDDDMTLVVIKRNDVLSPDAP
jgi:serine phosphatase RsbU (regulator of sigma subunit)